MCLVTKAVYIFLCFADDICDYFGVKIGMYFAWLGFYTNSMLYPAVIGFLLWILAEADQVPETFSVTRFISSLLWGCWNITENPLSQRKGSGANL